MLFMSCTCCCPISDGKWCHVFFSIQCNTVVISKVYVQQREETGDGLCSQRQSPFPLHHRRQTNREVPLPFDSSWTKKRSGLTCKVFAAVHSTAHRPTWLTSIRPCASQTNDAVAQNVGRGWCGLQGILLLQLWKREMVSCRRPTRAAFGPLAPSEMEHYLLQGHRHWRRVLSAHNNVVVQTVMWLQRCRNTTCVTCKLFFFSFTSIVHWLL